MRIPRTVHFIFGLKAQVEPFHLMHYLCLRSCLEVIEPESIQFHYGEEPWGPLWDEVRPTLQLRPIATSRRQPRLEYATGSAAAVYRYAHLSDFLRVAILEEEGGIYADMDTLFVRPFPAQLFEHDYVMGRERVDTWAPAAVVGGSLCNALLMGRPGAAFGRLWQEAMEEEFDGSWSRHSTFLPFKLSQLHPELIHVEPEESFFALDWTSHGIERLFAREEVLPPSVYSLHLWSHLWWDRRRTDVSRFHQGRLTEAYVRYAKSTYARYARRFLPSEAARWAGVRWPVTACGHGLEDGAAKLWSAARRWRRSVAAATP